RTKSLPGKAAPWQETPGANSKKSPAAKSSAGRTTSNSRNPPNDWAAVGKPERDHPGHSQRIRHLSGIHSPRPEAPAPPANQILAETCSHLHFDPLPNLRGRLV